MEKYRQATRVYTRARLETEASVTTFRIELWLWHLSYDVMFRIMGRKANLL